MTCDPSEDQILDERPDRPEEACGVFGVYAPGEDVARLTYFGLHALQHRGQESAGIAVGDDETVTVTKNLGLVSRVFRESDLDSLTGDVAIGHTRYSTTGSSTSWENAQPHLSAIGNQVIALAHNGNLVNTTELRDALHDKGLRFRSTTDSEVMTSLVGYFTQETHHIRDGIRETMKLIRGAFAVVMVTENALYAFRDPHGVRPLVLGKLPDDRGWIVSSETCGLDIVGAEFVRDVAPGEMLKISGDGVEADQAVPAEKRSLCMFEFVYFARPDSDMYDCSLYEARRRMGAALALEAPAEADMVMGVPDSGIPAAVGFAAASGIPYGDGLAKNRYVGRTFISPSQTLRQQGIRLKLNPLKHVIKGQAPRGRRRFDRARQHHQEAGRAPPRRRRRRGAHAHHIAAGEVAVLLWHRHRHAGPAHRLGEERRGDPRARRRRLARIPVASRHGRGHRRIRK